MKPISSLLVLALICSVRSYSKAPIDDYDLKCIARNSAGQIALKIESGIDPSGEFDTWIMAKNPFTALHGVQYMASAKPGKKKDTIVYTSESYITPPITLYVDWSNRMPGGFYRGSLLRKQFNQGKPLELNCSYKMQ